MTSLLILVAAGQSAAINTDWSLLEEPEIQQELRLDQGQRARVKTILAKAEAEFDHLVATRIYAEAITRHGKVLQLARPKLAKFGGTLSPDRQKRAQQISLQRRGSWLLADPAVLKEIGGDHALAAKVERDQDQVERRYRARIDAYVKQHHVPTESIKGGGKIPLDTPGIKKLERERQDALWVVIWKDLSPQQSKRLKALLGPPFRSP